MLIKGGNAAASVVHRIKRENLEYGPKLQILIYPWTQIWHHNLPSIQRYLYTGVFQFPILICGLWYNGMTNVSNDLINSLVKHNHFHLVDAKKRDELESYLDVNLIPDEYKKGRSYYDNYEPKKFFPVSSLSEDDPLSKLDEKEKEKLLNFITSPIAWPGLESDRAMSTQPKAYFIISEMDILKDEGLIYAQRLRNVGVPVEIAYYKSTFHSITQQVGVFSIVDLIIEDMAKYIERNI
jgi:acetyl esterase/lipase